MPFVSAKTGQFFLQHYHNRRTVAANYRAGNYANYISLERDLEKQIKVRGSEGFVKGSDVRSKSAGA